VAIAFLRTPVMGALTTPTPTPNLINPTGVAAAMTPTTKCSTVTRPRLRPQLPVEDAVVDRFGEMVRTDGVA
jgi:hypothetical protein